MWHLIEHFRQQSQKLLFSVFVRGKGRPRLRDFSGVYTPPQC